MHQLKRAKRGKKFIFKSVVFLCKTPVLAVVTSSEPKWQVDRCQKFRSCWFHPQVIAKFLVFLGFKLKPACLTEHLRVKSQIRDLHALLPLCQDPQQASCSWRDWQEALAHHSGAGAILLSTLPADYPVLPADACSYRNTWRSAEGPQKMSTRGKSTDFCFCKLLEVPLPLLSQWVHE